MEKKSHLSPTDRRPMILAPAGSRQSFLAAIAAEADAIYCGLKQFSARMEAANFSIEELAALTGLAHEKNIQVYVTLNSLVKPGELAPAGQLIDTLNRVVHPDALIIQDLSIVELAAQAGFSGQLHLSTLANVSFPAALSLVREALGVHRVVVPRELSVDEIREMAKSCPEDLELEVFIHGALCYGVSGRCYWSSYMGGKSGLRGRCVQPCRRIYSQPENRGRLFSCRDLSLDVLVKVLAEIPKVSTWKIEGRKKGPHYVYYTVQAYRMLRDQGGDRNAKRAASALLERALGRPGTHYHFLPQRPQNPVRQGGETGSGLFVGKVQGPRENPYLAPREALISGDVLRIGYEDGPGHAVLRVGRAVPKAGRLFLTVNAKAPVVTGTPVFLVDRRETALDQMIVRLDAELARIPAPVVSESRFVAHTAECVAPSATIQDVRVMRSPQKNVPSASTGLWLSEPLFKKRVSLQLAAGVWWWLPPVLWPDGEKALRKTVSQALRAGARKFVLNAAWQMALFATPEGLDLWAGPFCNATNPLALHALAKLGLTGAIVSPELGGTDFLDLAGQSVLPLGIVVSGNWPLCISRVLPEALRPDVPFDSPMGEQAWAHRYGQDIWVYPNWSVDITAHRHLLEKAGYRHFVHLVEPLPQPVALKTRPGLWNWDLDLK
jgi:putative protease